MEQNLSWEAECHSAGQEIPAFYRFFKIHHSSYKRLPLDPTLWQLNPTLSLTNYLLILMNRHISVGITTGYELDGRGSIPSRGKRFLLVFRPALRPAQTSQWVPMYLFPWIRRPGREADHSFPSSAKIKKCEAIPPLPVRLHEIVLN
jgi:hypothetical protein